MILSNREQHEHSYLSRMCYILWTEIPVPAYEHMPLQPEDLKQLSIVYGMSNPCIRFKYKGCSYYS